MYVFKKKKQKTVPSAVDVDDAQRRKLVSYTWPYQLEERWLWRWPSSARFPPCSVQGKWSTTMALATAVVDLTVTVYDWRHDDVSWSGRKFYRLAYASRAHPVELEKCVNSDGHHHQRPNDVGSTNRYCLFFFLLVAMGRAWTGDLLLWKRHPLFFFFFSFSPYKRQLYHHFPGNKNLHLSVLQPAGRGQTVDGPICVTYTID